MWDKKISEKYNWVPSPKKRKKQLEVLSMTIGKYLTNPNAKNLGTAMRLIFPMKETHRWYCFVARNVPKPAPQYINQCKFCPMGIGIQRWGWSARCIFSMLGSPEEICLYPQLEIQILLPLIELKALVDMEIRKYECPWDWMYETGKI